MSSDSVYQLRMNRPVYADLVYQAQERLPEEVCGLFYGTVIDGTGYLAGVTPVGNAHTEPRTHYAMDADEQAKAWSVIEEAGFTVFGVYHSHPSARAVPSGTDREFMQPWLRYLIIGRAGEMLGEWKVRCWRILHPLGTGVQELPLDVE